MHKPWVFLFIAPVIIFVIVCGCTTTAPSPRVSPAPVPTAAATASTTQTQLPVSTGPFTLAVDSLIPGSVLPDICTCNGESESPLVSWLNVPAGTQSLVLILDDPDAPAGTFTHWTVYNIPPATREIPKSQPNAGVLSNGARQGVNSAGSIGYFPPCPPPGKPHRYVFTVYAVDMGIAPATADRAAISLAMTGHTLGRAQFVTTYGH
jgi:Raf kinase inhibitor-like YbhB/YbcL family protein